MSDPGSVMSVWLSPPGAPILFIRYSKRSHFCSYDHYVKNRSRFGHGRQYGACSLCCRRRASRRLFPLAAAPGRGDTSACNELEDRDLRVRPACAAISLELSRPGPVRHWQPRPGVTTTAVIGRAMWHSPCLALSLSQHGTDCAGP